MAEQDTSSTYGNLQIISNTGAGCSITCIILFVMLLSLDLIQTYDDVVRVVTGCHSVLVLRMLLILSSYIFSHQSK